MRYALEFSEYQHNGIHYCDFLKLLDQALRPRTYLEVGTRSGDSLKCFTCDAICIDPSFIIDSNVTRSRRKTLLFQMTSDTFFAEERVRGYFPCGIDIAFLDGLHRAEFLLRDLMNIEHDANQTTLVVIHDCLPDTIKMATRNESDSPEAWSGDVWKIILILKNYRPDLRLMLVDCPPTGLLVVTKFDPDSSILRDNYFSILDEIASTELNDQRLRDVWTAYPLLNSRALAAAPHDLTALFTLY